MVHFIERLRGLDSLDKMNRVLENFSVQQVRLSLLIRLLSGLFV